MTQLITKRDDIRLSGTGVFEFVAGIAVTATSTSARTAIPSVANGTRQYVVSNQSSSVWAFVAFGDSTVTATTASQAVRYDSQWVGSIPDGATHVAYYAASSVDLQISFGWGV